jgi:hypothetical protein
MTIFSHYLEIITNAFVQGAMIMRRRLNIQPLRIATLISFLLMFSLPFAIAQTNSKIQPIRNKTIKATTQSPGIPDIIISHYELTRQSNTLYFTLTFKNIGDGPAGCFDWRMMDSVKGIKMGSVCEGKPANWQLLPGQEVTINGEVRRSEMWVWPDEKGYMSKLRFNANHSSQINEKDTTNNHCQFKAIYWDQNIILNAY